MKGVDVSFSVTDLQNEPEGTACWDGVSWGRREREEGERGWGR